MISMPTPPPDPDGRGPEDRRAGRAAMEEIGGELFQTIFQGDSGDARDLWATLRSTAAQAGR